MKLIVTRGYVWRQGILFEKFCCAHPSPNLRELNIAVRKPVPEMGK